MRTMKAGFYIIMAAQFFSSLADNALLIAAIAMAGIAGACALRARGSVFNRRRRSP